MSNGQLSNSSKQYARGNIKYAIGNQHHAIGNMQKACQHAIANSQTPFLTLGAIKTIVKHTPAMETGGEEAMGE